MSKLKRKVVACIIARTVSTRLPLKIFRELSVGVSMIDLLISRVKLIKEIDEIYLCTSEEAVDDIMEDVAVKNNIKIYRGSPDEVIQRMVNVGDIELADIILRITGDNPLSSIEYVNYQIDFLNDNNLDYVRIVDVPIGSSIEVIKFDALKECYSKMDKSVSEYLMLFLFEPSKFKCGILKVFRQDYSNYSLTVDTPHDLDRTKKLLTFFNNYDLATITLNEIMEIYIQNPSIFPELNQNGMIKYPYDKQITIQEFKIDMDRRKKNSLTLELYD